MVQTTDGFLDLVSSGPKISVSPFFKAPLRFNIATVSPVEICWTHWNERVATWKTLDPFWPPEWQVKILSYVFFLVTNSLGLLICMDRRATKTCSRIEFCDYIAIIVDWIYISADFVSKALADAIPSALYMHIAQKLAISNMNSRSYV